MLDKVVIANRGEIALRILRACRELGIKTVAVHSTVDRNLKHVGLADESVCIGPPPAGESYLNMPAIIAAAEVTDARRSIRATDFFPRTPISPSASRKAASSSSARRARRIRLMGDKVAAISAMKAAGVPCVPGSGGPLGDDAVTNGKIARDIGYPVIIKAAGGGGGRGMRVVHTEAHLLNAIAMTSAEAQAAFGNDQVYMEKFLESPRHIEIQVLADDHGNAIHLGERDCSMQRRHQKVVEEAPAPGITPSSAPRSARSASRPACASAIAAPARSSSCYENGELLLHRDEHAHPGRASGDRDRSPASIWCSEQLRIAAGEKLSLRQKDIRSPATRSSAASTPKTRTRSCRARHDEALRLPGGPGVRVDTHVYAGYRIPPNYDSMIGKLIVHGRDRATAIARTRIALSEMVVEGIKTNMPLQQRILADARLPGRRTEHPLPRAPHRRAATRSRSGSADAMMATSRLVAPHDR